MIACYSTISYRALEITNARLRELWLKVVKMVVHFLISFHLLKETHMNHMLNRAVSSHTNEDKITQGEMLLVFLPCPDTLVCEAQIHTI